ncbi:MAG: DUF1080 domain-containing protein [Planctomycetaceae bacterium]|nr:DUF1080 domain-containing protein [Planctomycetaceae bacterium]
MFSPVIVLCILMTGCTQIGVTETKKVEVIETYNVDRAAAFPEQKPGTQPPVLTGVLKLTDEELKQGRINLFDGVSTYGWEEKPVILIAKGNVLFAQDDGLNVVKHWFPDIKFGSTLSGANIGEGNGGTFEAEVKYAGGFVTLPLSDKFGYKEFRIYPTDTRLLGKDDWKPASGKATSVWTNDGEVIELRGGSGMVESNDEFGDFVLQLEYMTETPVNSGVFFRCIRGEEMNGYECQIFNNPPDDQYKKYIGTDTGGLFRRQVGRNVGTQDNVWNYVTIAASGNRFATWVNGIQVTDWTDKRPEDPNPRKGLRTAAGTIQLQGHDETTVIKFRNIRIAVAKDSGKETTE